MTNHKFTQSFRKVPTKIARLHLQYAQYRRVTGTKIQIKEREKKLQVFMPTPPPPYPTLAPLSPTLTSPLPS